MKSWDVFLAELEKELGHETVARWLKPLKVLRFDAANLYLSAEDSFQIDWFEEHIRPRLRGKFLNNNFRPIAVHLSHLKNSPNKEISPPDPFSIHPDFLDPEMSGENFIVSPQNQMASQLIGEVEKKTFNPLLIYGPKKCGKTHLLTSAALLLKKKGFKVYFVRADRFTEHVVAAIRLQKMEEFRKVYREIDALVVDDIQNLKGKAATQEEFFHTFNALHTAGKYLVLSANTAPSKLVEIEPRLISRFEWGISMGMEKVNPLEILKQKTVLWNWKLSKELLEWLIVSFSSDPLIPFHSLAMRARGKPLTIESAKVLLNDFLEKEKELGITPEKIIKAVASHYGIRPEDLLGKSQMREFVGPRKAAMYLCREKLKLPFQKIGEIFGRDHSTVMTSIDQVQKREMDRALLENLKF